MNSSGFALESRIAATVYLQSQNGYRVVGSDRNDCGRSWRCGLVPCARYAEVSDRFGRQESKQCSKYTFI